MKKFKNSNGLSALVTGIITIIAWIIWTVILLAEISTKYTIKNGKLFLSVPGKKAKLDIQDIVEIKELWLVNLEYKNYFATGIDRLVIITKDWKKYIVSPKYKDEFVKELQKINPEIKSEI